MESNNQAAAAERPLPEKAVFRLEFGVAYPLASLEAISDFNVIHFDIEKMGIDDLKGLSVIDHKIAGGNRFIVINAVFERLIKKTSDRYTELHHAVTTQLDTTIDYNFRKKHLEPYGKVFDNLSASIIRYIIWRKNISAVGNLEKAAKKELKWSLDSQTGLDPHSQEYWVAGEGIDIEAADHTLTNEDFTDYYKLKTTGVPLYKELLLEAEHLVRNGQYRSAFIMLYTSLEIATKSLITTRQLETSWLIEHIPTPNIHLLHKEYIPKFTEAVITGDDLEKVRNLMNKRNEIAHTGVSPDQQTVKDYYFFVKRQLYKIDSSIGFEWASSVIFPSVDIFY